MTSYNNAEGDPTKAFLQELVDTGDLDSSVLEQASPLDENPLPDATSYRIPPEVAQKISPPSNTIPSPQLAPLPQADVARLKKETAITPTTPPAIDLSAMSPEEFRDYGIKNYGIDIGESTGAFKNFGKNAASAALKTPPQMVKGAGVLQAQIENYPEQTERDALNEALKYFDVIDERSTSTDQNYTNDDKLFRSQEAAAKLNPLKLSKNEIEAIKEYERVANNPYMPPEERENYKRAVRELYQGGSDRAQESINLNPAWDKSLFKYGAAGEKNIDDLIPISATDRERTSGVIGSGVGSLGAYVAGAAIPGVGPLLAAGGGMAQIAGSQYDDAAQHGATEEQARKAGIYSAPIGLTEALPAGHILQIMKKSGVTHGAAAKIVNGLKIGDKAAWRWFGEKFPRLAEYSWNALKGAAEEGGQEYIENTWTNYVASDAVGYDPNRKINEGAIPSIVGGGAAGGIGGTAATFIGRRAHNARPSNPPISPSNAPESSDQSIPPAAPPAGPTAEIIPENQLNPEDQATMQGIDNIISPASEKYKERITINNPEAKLPPETPVTQQEIDDLIFDDIPSENPTLNEPMVIPQVDSEGNTVGESYYEPTTKYSEPITPERTLQDIISSRKPVKAESAEDIAVAGVRAATSPLNEQQEPTQAQKDAGNYRKGHVNIQGLDISLENPRGSTRTGVDEDGEPWSVTMEHDYGYIKGTVGKDGDHVDTFLGPNPQATNVFVIDTKDPTTKKFDEHKVFIGFNSQDEAEVAFAKAYPGKAVERFMGATEMAMPQFKRWVKSGRKMRPVSRQPDIQPAAIPTLPQPSQQLPTTVSPVVPQTATANSKAIEEGQQKSLEVMKKALDQGTNPPIEFVMPKVKKRKSAGAMDLLQFIASRGGMQDYSSELKTIGLKKIIPFYGKLIHEGGMQLDYAREAAREAGYGDFDTLNDFLEALAQSSRGKKIYTPRDQQAITDREQARRVKEQPANMDDAYKVHAESLGIQTEGRDVSEIIADIHEREGIQAEGTVSDEIRDIQESDIDAAIEDDIPFIYEQFDNSGVKAEDKVESEYESVGTEISQEQEAAGDNYSIRQQSEQPARVTEKGEELRQSPTGSGETRGESTPPRKITTEQTPIGEQAVIPGAEKASDKDMAQRGAEKPLQGKVPQKGMTGETNLFDQSENQQNQLFDNQVPESKPKEQTLKAPAKPQEQATGVYSHAEHLRLLPDILAGKLSAEEIKTLFDRTVASRAQLMEEMKKLTKQQIEKTYGVRAGSYGRTETKEWLMKQAFDRMISDFYYGESFMWSPTEETMAAAYERLIKAQTDEDIKTSIQRRESEVEKMRERRQAQKKALTDPETLEEFRTFVREYGLDKLTPEQLAIYDKLSVTESLKKRKEAKEKASVVKGVETTPENLNLEIIETKHTQKGHDLFVVQLGERVEKDIYTTLNATAKRLGGYYSSYRAGGAIPGFQFPTREAAESFRAAAKGEDVTTQKGSKPETRADRLRGQGQKMIERGEESLAQDRKANTEKRARQAAGAEADAAAAIAMGKTLIAIADKLEAGEPTSLELMSTRADVETIHTVMRRAMLESDHEKKDLSHKERENLRGRKFDETDARRIEYPYPQFHTDNIPSIIKEIGSKPGFKQLAQHLSKLYEKGKKSNTTLVSVTEPKFIEKVKEAYEEFEKYTMGWVAEEGVQSYMRAQRMGLTNLPLLRQAVREYSELMSNKPKADPIKEAERKLVGRKFEGYFPTPKTLATRMAEELDINDTHRVLEPSAGKGSLIEAAITAGAKIENIAALEVVGDLQDILKLKGYNVVGRNFLEHDGEYDRVIMNPPFENNQDIEHVQHAYKLLATDGKIVAIMSEGPFFRGDSKATAFREWLEEVGGVSEKLPEGSFKESDRSTGVNTRIVIINKTTVSEGKFNKAEDNKIDTTGFVTEPGGYYQYNPSQEFSNKQDALIEDMERLSTKIFGKNLNLRFTSGMAEPDGGEVFGAYTRERYPNAIAHFAAISLAKPKNEKEKNNPWKTLGHEGIHFLRMTDAIPDRLWKILEAKAKSDWMEHYNIETRYKKHFQKRKNSDGSFLTEEEVQERMLEEAVAEALGDHVYGNRAKGSIALLFDKIKRFIEGVRRWLNNEGFYTPEDILADISRGKYKQDSGVSVVPKSNGGALQAAYHGSPYNFDKFTLDHIGTGEGAQAYGWGLYFTGKKEVAEYYRDGLTKILPEADVIEITMRELGVDEGFAKYHSRDLLHAAYATESPAILARSLYLGNRKLRQYSGGETSLPNDQPKLESLVKKLRAARPKGEIYKVDLPEDNELLNWDKPLSEQSESVKSALKAASDPIASERMSKSLGQPVYVIGTGYFKSDTKARDLYETLALKNDKGSAEAASRFLNSHGIKGIKYLDGASRGKGEGHHNYVIFDDSSIKILDTYTSAQESGAAFQRPIPTINDKRQGDILENSFEYPDERVREVLFDKNKSFFDPETFKGAIKGDFSNLKRKLQDRMQGFRDIQATIEKMIGEKLPESENPVLIEELYSSRVGAKFDKLGHKVKEPVTKLLADIQSKVTKESDGNAIDQVEAYMMALHAPERNKYIAQKNPKFKDGAGSGMTDAEAAEIIKQAESQPYFKQMQEVSELMRKMLDDSLEGMYSSGLISKDTYMEYKGRYKNYFPMRGFQELLGKDDNDTGMKRGKGYDVRGQEFRQAFGRKSRAANILAHSFAIAEESIIRGEKNRVANTLLNLALKYKNPNVWAVNELEMKPVVNAETGMVEYRPQLVNDKHRPNDTVLYAKRRGKAYRIHFKDERLGKAIRNMDMDDSGAFINMMGNASRWFASVNTRWNPSFVIRNAVRDAIAGSITLQQYNKSIPGIASTVLKTYFKAAAGVYGGLKGKENTYWQKQYQEFLTAGGKVAFNDIQTIQDRQKRLLKEMMLLQNGNLNASRRGVRAMIQFIGDMNDTVENALRLATFVAAKEAGVSKNVSASMAKNVTVNFNRRGEWGYTLNSLYPFFNAGVQSTAVLFKAMQHRRVQQVVISMAIMGFAMDMINALWSPEDDDGELLYDKISQWEKESNIIFMLPKGELADLAKEYLPVNKYKGAEYIKLPKPYGYRVFGNLGQNVGALSRGALSPIEAAANVGKSVANSFSPIDGGQGPLNFLAPTVLDPIVDVATNKDWLGNEIVPGAKYDTPFPSSQKAKYNTSGLAKWAAESLNVISGGDKVTPGSIDVSPAVLDYYYGFATGGMGRFVKDTAIAANRAVDKAMGKQVPEDEKLTIKDIPIVRDLVGATSDYGDKTKAKDRVQEIYDIKNRLEQYIETGDNAGAAKYREANKKILFVTRGEEQVNMYYRARAVKKALKDIGETRQGIRNNTSLNDSQKTEKLNKLYDAERKVVDDFNNLYNLAKDKTSANTRPDGSK